MAREVAPVQAPLLVPWAGQTFWDWLFSGFQQKPDGGWELNNMPAYPGQLNVDPNSTAIGDVNAMFHAGDPGMASMQQLIGQMMNPNPVFDLYRQRVEQTGGIGGAPTDFMNAIAMQGGIGAPGATMNRIKELGAPSDLTGSILSNLVGYGVAHPLAGQGMIARAQGLPTVAGNFLAPFLANATPYKAPGV